MSIVHSPNIADYCPNLGENVTLSLSKSIKNKNAQTRSPNR